MNQCLPDRDALERTVDSHVSKLRKKIEDLGLRNNAHQCSWCRLQVGSST
jgi:DNA-binding response OmpR family regulator